MPVKGFRFKRRTYEDRARLFELMYAGASMTAAAQVVGVHKSSAQFWWRQAAPMNLTLAIGHAGGVAGGVVGRPWEFGSAAGLGGPPARQRRPLTREDRAVIAALLRRRAAGQKVTLAQIGALIGRDKSVVSREIARNSGPDGSYFADLADLSAHQKRRRPKEFRLHANPRLCRQVEAWMDDGWSPKLIATMLAADHPHMIMDRVSHETIYQALYVQTRGSLRKDLHQQLSTKRARRKPQGGARRANSPYREAFTISQRPAEVADRAVPGHWEGDLVMGTAGGVAVGTLVERTTRFTILLHLPGRHDAESVAAAMIREMGDLPEHLRRSLTWDRGTELARYDKIQLELAMPVYFCDPHSPWQRGTNENTNRLLRHWLTKGTDLARFSAADLRRIAASLNARPRPTLDLKTPAQALDELLTNPAAA
jgi:IS30 family transposase